MAITNFYLPTGLTVSGSTSLTGSLHATKNVIAESFTGSFSGSDAYITNISANVISADAIRLPDPYLLEVSTIRVNDVQILEQLASPIIIADEIYASNILLPDPFLFVVTAIRTGDLEVLGDANLNNLYSNNINSDNIISEQISASNLYIADPFVVIADTIQTTDLEVLGNLNANSVSASNLTIDDPFIWTAGAIQTQDLEVLGNVNISGNLNVYTDETYNNLSAAIVNNVLDVKQSLKILDTVSQTSSSLNNAYDSLRLKRTGSLNSSGFIRINLTSLSSKFDTSSLDFITLNTSIKEGNRWTYNAASVELYNSGSNVYVEISAGPNNIYRLIAINEKNNLFIV